MRRVAQIVGELSELAEDPLAGVKAMEYATFMTQMAAAINEGDEAKLEELTEQLNKRSFL